MKSCDCDDCIEQEYVYVLIDKDVHDTSESICAVTTTLQKAVNVIHEFNEKYKVNYKEGAREWRIEQTPLDTNLTIPSQNSIILYNEYDGQGNILWKLILE